MPRHVPYTKTKIFGDILVTLATAGAWLIFRIPWELYQWTRKH